MQESRARKQRPGEKLKAAVVLCVGCSSGWWLRKDRVSQRDIQGVVVLHQGRVLVVQDQVLEGGVEVVGFGEAVASCCLVDHAVLGVTVHPARERRESRSGACQSPDRDSKAQVGVTEAAQRYTWGWQEGLRQMGELREAQTAS